MKRLFIPVAILLVLAFIITACSSASPTTTQTAISTSTTSVAPITTTTLATTIQSSSTTTKPTTSAATTIAATTSQPTTSSPTSNKYGGTLKVIESSPPGGTLGAEWEGNVGTYNTQQWACERLMKEKLDGTMQPELVESWEVTSSGASPNVLLHLRKGVKFSDGSDWNAAALAWNLKMYQDGKMYGSTTNYWKSWDILDNYTVRLNYTQYLNTLTRSWENYFFVSPTAYDKNGIEWVRTHMVGTGAFVQTDFVRDVSTTLKKNPNYWQQGRPYLDGVQIVYVVDQLTREALMKSGGGDLLYSTPLQAGRFSASDFNIISRNSGPYALFPDSKNADSPWSKVKVRMAADYAIDKEGLNTALGYGFGAAAYQLSSPATMAYDPDLSSQYRKYDIAKAKQLLTEAGYPSGFKTTMFVDPALFSSDMAVDIQASWAKAGIIADLQYPQPAAWASMTTNNPTAKVSSIYATRINEWSNYDTTLNVYFPKSDGGFSYQFTQKPGGVDAWNATKDRALTAPAPDPVILKQIGDAFFNDCTAIPITYAANILVTSKKLNDSGLLKYGTSIAWDYANAWLSK